MLFGSIPDLTKGHPYYSQLVLQQIALYHTVKGRLPEPEILLEEILAVEKDYLERTWEDLSSSIYLFYRNLPLTQQAFMEKR